MNGLPDGFTEVPLVKLKELTDEVNRLRAENAALRPDARRYRAIATAIAIADRHGNFGVVRVDWFTKSDMSRGFCAGVQSREHDNWRESEVNAVLALDQVADFVADHLEHFGEALV